MRSKREGSGVENGCKISMFTWSRLTDKCFFILAPCGSTGIQLLLFLGLAADFVRNVSCENEVFIIIQFRLASLSMEPIPIFSMVISSLSAHSFIYLMNARAMGHFRILGIGLELACN